MQYPKVASWDSFFQSSVSRVLLTLVGSPPGSSPDIKSDPNRSVDIVPVSDKQSVKPKQTSPNHNGKYLNMYNDFYESIIKEVVIMVLSVLNLVEMWWPNG